MPEVRRNLEKDGIEISFPNKPEDSVLDWLKKNHYRWSRYNKVWFRNYDEANWKLATEYFAGESQQERPSAWINEDTKMGDLTKRLFQRIGNTARYDQIGENILIGTKVEGEHSQDELETWRIVFDHLWEDPRYYTNPKPKDWGKKEIAEKQVEDKPKKEKRKTKAQIKAEKVVDEIEKMAIQAEQKFEDQMKTSSKTINQLAVEEKIKNYIPTVADIDFIKDFLTQTSTHNLYDACLHLYNYRAGNHGDLPIQREDEVGDEFILKMAAHYIKTGWRGTVVKDIQKLDFKNPGFTIRGPELRLPPKEIKKKVFPASQTIEEQVKCLKNITGHDPHRPAFDYVYRDENTVVATDAYVLVSIPTTLGKEYTFYDPKTGSIRTVDAEFPKYKGIIPTVFEFTSDEVDLRSFLEIIAPYENLRKIVIPEGDVVSHLIKVSFQDKEKYYDAFKLFKAAESLYCNGTVKVTFSYPDRDKNPIVIKDTGREGQLALVMPVMIVSSSAIAFWTDFSGIMAKSKDQDFVKEHIIVASIPKVEPEPEKPVSDPYNKVFLREQDELKIYLVDGEAVRRDHIEFVSGGHGYVYDYIPKEEVWIDDNQKDKPSDMEATITHELYEIKKMRENGLSYNEAHELANVVESEKRNNEQPKINKPEDLKTHEKLLIFVKSQGKSLLTTQEEELHDLIDKNYSRNQLPPASMAFPKDKSNAIYKMLQRSIYYEGKKVEPYQMIYSNFQTYSFIKEAKAEFDMMTEPLATNMVNYQKQHKENIQKALSDGKEVPVVVLAEYPDLTEKRNNEEMEPSKKEELSPSMKEKLLEHAGLLGKSAFLEGKSRVPAHDNNIMEFLKDKPVGSPLNVPLMDAWLQGWDEANLANPVPSSVALPIVKDDDKEYFVDFKLQELRDVHTTERVPFIDIFNEDLKAKIRGIRAESGPNVYMKGLDDKPEFNPDSIVLSDLASYSPEQLDKLIAQLEEAMRDILHVEQNTERAIKLRELIGIVIDARNINNPEWNRVFHPERKTEPVSSLILTDYKNDFEVNKAIEALLTRKWNDKPESWSTEELEFLKGYSGYGGLDEFGEISKGSLFEFYTPEKVIEKMWGLAYKYGYDEGPMIEPSSGPGLFLKREYVKSSVLKSAYEINKYSAKICKLLYPEVNVNDGAETMYFEQLFIKNNYTVRDKVSPRFKLVIGNPPYGEAQGMYIGMGEKTYTKAKNYIDYFIFRGLDLLVPGGLLIYIIGAEVAAGGKPWLDSGPSKCKEMIQAKGKLIDAYRLPEGLFARTNVVTDIIILKKR